MKKTLITLLTLASSQAVASEFTPYLGLNLGYNQSKGADGEVDKSGLSLQGKILGSWELQSVYLDAGVGYQYQQLDASNVKITTKSMTLDLEARYKLNKSWSLGPALKVMDGTDNTNSEVIGSSSQSVALFGKLTYQTKLGDLPARLEMGLGSTVGLERNLTTAMVGLQVGLPWVNKKTSVSQKIYVTEEMPDLKVDLKVAQVRFNTDKFELSQKDHAKLTKLAKFLKENNSEYARIKIAGHTDITGDATYNRALSQDRADSVMKVFILGGVPESKMSAYGYGPSRPVDASNSPDAWAKNRRTEIEFFGVKNRVEFNKKLMEILK